MPGLTTPKGGATQTTTQQQQVPAYVQTAQQNLLNQSNNILGPQLQQQQYTQAGVNADQSGAYDLTRSLAQSAFTGGASQPAAFDPKAYLAANPDVAADGYYGQHAQEHYNTFGVNEGRAMPTSMTPAQTALANATARATMGSGITSPNLMDFTQNQGIWQAPTTAAQATTRDATSQGYAAQGYDPTRSSAEQVTGGEIQQFLNPYTQNVVDTTLAQMARTRDETAAKNNARAAAAGSFGGSRQAIQSAQLDRSFGDQAAQTTATLMSAGYDKATATALANASMRQQTGQANQQAANTAAQFGASANNTAAQFGAGAANNASLANASAFNNASQFNAGAQNSRDAQNAQTGASLLQANNQNQLSRYNTDLSKYQAENAQANAAVQLQQAARAGDQAGMLAATQALTTAGNSQYQMAQANIQTPLQYLQLLQQATPQNYGGTNTTTAPNTAQSPLQSLLGAGLFLGGKAL